MHWRPLSQFRDPQCPKLNNLRIAAQAGLRVPATWWAAAAELPSLAQSQQTLTIDNLYNAARGLTSQSRPLMIRAEAPRSEATGQQESQFAAASVASPRELAAGLARVVDSLPRDDRGLPQGILFIQPHLAGPNAGVASFDGYYFQRQMIPTPDDANHIEVGKPEENPAAEAVEHGFLSRRHAFSDWLREVWAEFTPLPEGHRRIEVEFVHEAQGYSLLQVRSAAEPVPRNALLTQSDYRETLGTHPSPWTTSALVAAGDEIRWLEAALPEIGSWHESLLVEEVARPWANAAVVFRLCDRLGLPRSWANPGLETRTARAVDQQFLVRRFAKNLPAWLRFQWLCWQQRRSAPQQMQDLQRQIQATDDLAELHRLTIEGFRLQVRLDLALGGIGPAGPLAPAGPTGRRMMTRYWRVGRIRDSHRRQAGLRSWLTDFGHHGSLAADVAQPRFAELEPLLLQDLAASERREERGPRLPVLRSGGGKRPGRRLRSALRRLGGQRQHRDAMLRLWQALREQILAAGSRLQQAGRLAQASDVFWLHADDLSDELVRSNQNLQPYVDRRRSKTERQLAYRLPSVATEEQIRQRLRQPPEQPSATAASRRFPGVAADHIDFEGPVVCGSTVEAVLNDVAHGNLQLSRKSVLVIPAWEPAWTLLLGRVGAVVADRTSDIPHAQRLVRQAHRPAILDCQHIFRHVRTGQRVRLSGRRGEVILLNEPATADAPPAPAYCLTR